MHSTALPPTAKARASLRTTQTWRCSLLCSRWQWEQKAPGLCALPTHPFHSLYKVPQNLVHKTASCQCQQSSALVGNSTARPHRWAAKHTPTCLQSTDPAIEGEGWEEHFPSLSASLQMGTSEVIWSTRCGGRWISFWCLCRGAESLIWQEATSLASAFPQRWVEVVRKPYGTHLGLWPASSELPSLYMQSAHTQPVDNSTKAGMIQ